MTERMTIKSIGIISFANIYALIGAATGAFGGFFYGGVLAALAQNPMQPGVEYPNWLIILFTTLASAVGYGIFAYVGTLITGLFLNLVLKITGGLTLNIETQ
ncbi:MAG: hypothetical protein P1V97_19510 [Planctomycetota bacterium]|nr:hypothetical protein [Planctomycetota bacterium]